MPTKFIDFNVETSLVEDDYLVGHNDTATDESRITAKHAISSMAQFIKPTWNNGATTFVGVDIDATDTASAVGSMLFRGRIGSVDRFTVRKDSRIRYGPDASNHWTHLVSATGDLALTGVGSTGGAFTVTPAAGKNVNFLLSGAGDFDVNSGIFYVDTSAGNAGVGTQVPLAKFHVVKAGTPLAVTVNTIACFQQNNLTTNDCLVSIIAGSAATSQLLFGDADSELIGRINYGHVNNEMRFYTNGSQAAVLTSAGNFGLGLTSGVSARIHAISTTEQFRRGYDASNYWKDTIGSSGGLTMAGVGAGGSFTVVPTAGQSIFLTLSGGGKLDVASDLIRLRTAKTPATAGAAGAQGDIAWDANFIYVCTATNAWKRVGIATW